MQPREGALAASQRSAMEEEVARIKVAARRSGVAWLADAHCRQMRG